MYHSNYNTTILEKDELVPDKDPSTHRINENTIALYVSSDNMNYSLIPQTSWEYQKDDKGIVTLTLKERLATRYIKLHVKYDERGRDFKAVNKATFLNEVANMLRVYQEADSRLEEYQYDSAGNRKLLRVTLARTIDFKSEYYTKTDRLKTDGRYAFAYDNAGNMVKKGNTFTISGDTVNFTTSGEGVEYWEYKYDLLNRLIRVTKNGNIVAEYAYDPEGFRVVKKAKGETTHYVFQGAEPIFEKRINDGKTKSYVYALGKYLARVDGVIGDPEAKKYFYHTDHAGSIRVITDQAGEVVYKADYFAFGTQFVKDGEFEELHGFTGKEYDPDIGLYYFNARWYDPDLGRFISEDPAGDPKNPNLYSYCGNNPLNRIDPSGELWWIFWSAIIGGLDSYLCGGDFLQGFCMGAATGAIGAGFGAALGGTTFGNIAGSALAGGITGEMFGEGFVKGAVYGAVAGAINLGVDKRYGEFASKSMFNKVLINGLKGGLNGLVRGGDFIEGFVYGFVYGYWYEFGAKIFAADSPASDGVGNAEDDDYQQFTSALELCDVQINLLKLQLENNSLTPEQREQINKKIDGWLQYKVRIQNSLPKFLWPTTGRITSPFTLWRESKNPEVYPSGRHRAIDIGNDVGTPIVAMADGIVTKITPNNQLSGNIIEIDYGNGFTSSFHHLNGFERNIAEGDKVFKGHVVGYMGETGDWCYGPHLHFELRYNGQLVNPEDYLPKFR